MHKFQIHNVPLYKIQRKDKKYPAAFWSEKYYDSCGRFRQEYIEEQNTVIKVKARLDVRVPSGKPDDGVNGKVAHWGEGVINTAYVLYHDEEVPFTWEGRRKAFVKVQ
jgi:hypothetical protein